MKSESESLSDASGGEGEERSMAECVLSPAGTEDSAHGSRTSANHKSSRAKAKRRRRKSRVVGEECLFNGSLCKYDVVRDMAKSCRWRIVDGNLGSTADEEERCNIYWIDVSNIYDRMQRLRPWQRINHFPGMTNIARKARMAQNLKRMRRLFPQDYNFYPKTWVLPTEFADFKTQFDALGKSKQIFIVKPDSGCQGRGIFLTSSLDAVDPMESQVAQQYIRRPLLIDKFKFDLRIYVLMTSVKPLRMYIFRDGLVRLATQEYVKPSKHNLSDRCMHLTNYAVNKVNDRFDRAEGTSGETGSKRSLRWFLKWIAETRGFKKSKIVWQRISQLCCKTILAVVPTLVREYEDHFERHLKGKEEPKSVNDPKSNTKINMDAYRKAAAAPECPQIHESNGSGDPVKGSRCFEVLGFDVMIDHNLKPWLIEVNHLPSFGTDSPIDTDVKHRLMQQVFRVIQVNAADARKHREWQSKLSEQRLLRTSTDKVAVDVTVSFEGVEDNLERCRERLEALYERYAPAKKDKIDILLKKYEGKEARLVDALEKKYAAAERERDRLKEREAEEDPLASEESPRNDPLVAGILKSSTAEARLSKTSYAAVFQDKFEALAWEARRLRDFDRLFPPPAQPPSTPPNNPIPAWWEDDVGLGYHNLIQGICLPVEKRRTVAGEEDDRHQQRQKKPLQAVSADRDGDGDGEDSGDDGDLSETDSDDESAESGGLPSQVQQKSAATEGSYQATSSSRRTTMAGPESHSNAEKDTIRRVRPNYMRFLVTALEAEEARHRRLTNPLMAHKKADHPPEAPLVSRELDQLNGGVAWRIAKKDETKRESKRELPKPGPAQLLAAERLSKGYSTIERQHLSRTNASADVEPRLPPNVYMDPKHAASAALLFLKHLQSKAGDVSNVAAADAIAQILSALGQSRTAFECCYGDIREIQELLVGKSLAWEGNANTVANPLAWDQTSRLAEKVRSASEYSREWRKRAEQQNARKESTVAVRSTLLQFPGAPPSNVFGSELDSAGDRKERSLDLPAQQRLSRVRPRGTEFADVMASQERSGALGRGGEKEKTATPPAAKQEGRRGSYLSRRSSAQWIGPKSLQPRLAKDSSRNISLKPKEADEGFHPSQLHLNTTFQQPGAAVKSVKRSRSRSVPEADLSRLHLASDIWPGEDIVPMPTENHPLHASVNSILTERTRFRLGVQHNSVSLPNSAPKPESSNPFSREGVSNPGADVAPQSASGDEASAARRASVLRRTGGVLTSGKKSGGTGQPSREHWESESRWQKRVARIPRKHNLDAALQSVAPAYYVGPDYY